MFLLFFWMILLFPSLLWALEPQLVVVTHQAASPLNLKYKYEEKKGETFVQLQLGGQKFALSFSKQLTKNPALPFFQCKFFDDFRFGLYGLLASQGASADYYHYFIRRGNRFHYIGYFPALRYRQDLKLFSSTEKDGPRQHDSFYRLQKNQLHRVRR